MIIVFCVWCAVSGGGRWYVFDVWLVVGVSCVLCVQCYVGLSVWSVKCSGCGVVIVILCGVS